VWACERDPFQPKNELTLSGQSWLEPCRAPRDDRDPNAKIERRPLISERHPCGATLSFAQRIEIDLAEPREDHCMLKLACRRIAGAGKGYSACVFE
jgi:hypothetical protein